MGKPTLSKYIQENLSRLGDKKEPGPYVTISREFGCSGYEIADKLLARIQKISPDDQWRVYRKEILRQLAEDAGLSEEIIEKERKSKPSLVKDFFRNVRQSGVPDSFEIRNKIAMMVRTVAFEGNAIIVGQGGASATADLENGISVRVEAPKDWRVVRICRRDGLKKSEAELKVDEVEKTRKYLRKAYEQQNPRYPAFDLVLDNSKFTTDQIADMIVLAMQLKNMIPKDLKM